MGPVMTGVESKFSLAPTGNGIADRPANSQSQLHYLDLLYGLI
jgi:hypothetical protein